MTKENKKRREHFNNLTVNRHEKRKRPIQRDQERHTCKRERGKQIIKHQFKINERTHRGKMRKHTWYYFKIPHTEVPRSNRENSFINYLSSNTSLCSLFLKSFLESYHCFSYIYCVHICSSSTKYRHTFNVSILRCPMTRILSKQNKTQ